MQIAKALGAYVVGVCSTDNVELVKNLGADEVVDYKKEDVTEKYTHQDFDLVFDTVGSAAEVIHSLLSLLFSLLVDATMAYGLGTNANIIPACMYAYENRSGQRVRPS